MGRNVLALNVVLALTAAWPAVAAAAPPQYPYQLYVCDQASGTNSCAAGHSANYTTTSDSFWPIANECYYSSAPDDCQVYMLAPGTPAVSSVEFIRFYARFANLYPLQTGTTTWQDDWTAAYLDLDSGFIWRSTGWDAQSESLVGGYYTYYVREQDDFGTPGWAYFAGMPVVYHETDYRTCNIFGGGCTTHTGAIEVWTNNFRGPYNEWSHTLNSDIPIGSCPSTFGGDLGDPAANFTRVDQNGDDVELCQFYDRVIVLLFVSGMCGSCHGQAIALQEYWEEYGDEGLLPIAVITADNFDNDPSEEYVADYASSYELTYPVVGDVDEGVFETYYDPWEGEPNTVIADRDMTVDRIDTCVLEGLCASAFDRAVDLL